MNSSQRQIDEFDVLESIFGDSFTCKSQTNCVDRVASYRDEEQQFEILLNIPPGYLEDDSPSVQSLIIPIFSPIEMQKLRYNLDIVIFDNVGSEVLYTIFQYIKSYLDEWQIQRIKDAEKQKMDAIIARENKEKLERELEFKKTRFVEIALENNTAASVPLSTVDELLSRIDVDSFVLDTKKFVHSLNPQDESNATVVSDRPLLRQSSETATGDCFCGDEIVPGPKSLRLGCGCLVGCFSK